MNDPYDLTLAMFALVISAILLVAGELYFVTRQAVSSPVIPHQSSNSASMQGGRAALRDVTIALGTGGPGNSQEPAHGSH